MSRLKTRYLAVLLPLALTGCVSEPSSRPVSRVPAVDLHAVLPPESLLREDTLAALAHDRNASRLGYVGVWAADGDRCAMMDQTEFEGFAVITPETIRHPAGTCTFPRTAPGETAAQLNATCEARGKTTGPRAFSIQMLNSEQLYLSTTPGQPGAQMVRCRLQK